MVSEGPKMNRSNTHRKPILLYCSQATQTEDDSVTLDSVTEDDSEAEDSDFPPCRVGNLPPLIISHYSPVIAPSHSCHPRAAMRGIQQQRLTISSEEAHHRQPNTGLGQSNIVNTVDATATVLHTKVISRYFLHVAMMLIAMQMSLAG